MQETAHIKIMKFCQNHWSLDYLMIEVNRYNVDLRMSGNHDPVP
jgi:hypothetical protein